MYNFHMHFFIFLKKKQIIATKTTISNYFLTMFYQTNSLVISLFSTNFYKIILFLLHLIFLVIYHYRFNYGLLDSKISFIGLFLGYII